MNSVEAARQLMMMSAALLPVPVEREKEDEVKEDDDSARPMIDSIMLANSWNLLDHTAEAYDLLKLCRLKGTKIHLGGIFASGILVGGNTYNYKTVDSNSPVFSKVQRWKTLCLKYNVELPIAAIGFSLLFDEVDSICIGVRSVAELSEVTSWFELSRTIPKALWKDAKSEGILSPHIELPFDSND